MTQPALAFRLRGAMLPVMKVRTGFHNRLFSALALAAALVAPASAPAIAADPATLDALFTRLAASGDDPAAAGRIAAEIRIEWGKSGSAAIDFLYRRGTDALDAGDAIAAAEHFTAAIDHDPGFLAAWEGRARAYHMSGHDGPALADLAHVLSIEPRQFDALAELGTIFEEIGNEEAARAAYRAALKINPGLTGASEAIAALSRRLEGQEI